MTNDEINLIQLNISFDERKEEIKVKSSDNNVLLIDKSNSDWNADSIFNFLVNLIFNKKEEDLLKIYKLKLNEKENKSETINEEFFNKYEHIYELFRIFVSKFNENIEQEDS